MKNNYRSKSFKAWLDKLQQESWQLELIISGFAIYGLFLAIEPLGVYYNTIRNEGLQFFSFVLLAGLISSSILMFTLTLHVILRGLWIGALGLRYVSGDIDYKKLNYTPKFEHYLRKRIGSFDRYIARLEDYCSVLFALSFLLIFYVLSLFLTIACIAAIAFIFIKGKDKSSILFVIGVIAILFILFGMFLTFIDFITQGYLKKNKWLSKLYFPFYWVFSFITLSFLYRPLVYNFLDNKFGKRLSLILTPIYFIIILTSSINYNRSNYLSINRDSKINYGNIRNYDDLIIEKGEFIRNVSIPSKVIEKPYLNIFIEYDEDIEDTIFDFNEGLKPKDDIRGLKSGIVFSNQSFNRIKKDSLELEYIKTLKSIYKIKIDTLNFTNIEFIFSQNKNKQLGFETVLNIENLQKGKHVLFISRLEKDNNSIENIPVASIPFWYYKQ